MLRAHPLQRESGFTPPHVQPGSLRLLPSKPSPGICSLLSPRRAVTFPWLLPPRKGGSVPSWVSQRKEPPLRVPHPAGTPRPPRGTYSRVIPELFQSCSSCCFQACPGREASARRGGSASVCHHGCPSVPTGTTSPGGTGEPGLATCQMCWIWGSRDKNGIKNGPGCGFVVSLMSLRGSCCPDVALAGGFWVFLRNAVSCTYPRKCPLNKGRDRDVSKWDSGIAAGSGVWVENSAGAGLGITESN